MNSWVETVAQQPRSWPIAIGREPRAPGRICAGRVRQVVGSTCRTAQRSATPAAGPPSLRCGQSPTDAGSASAYTQPARTSAARVGAGTSRPSREARYHPGTRSGPGVERGEMTRIYRCAHRGARVSATSRELEGRGYHAAVSVRSRLGISFQPAEPAQVRQVAELRWDWGIGNGHEARTTRDRFAEDFQRWFDAHRSTHLCVVGVDRDHEVVAFGFVALTPRVPAPNRDERRSADVQAVFVTPALRNTGIGGHLIEQLVMLARDQGAEHVTVHSSSRAVTAYERAGFERDPLMLNQLL